MNVESKIAEVVALIQTAQQSWKGWDFGHEPGRCTCHMRYNAAIHSIGPSQDWAEREQWLLDDGHEEWCTKDILDAEKSFERIVARDAKRAAEYGQQAIEALGQRKLSVAMVALEEARGIERDYGADPVWSKPYEALKALM